MTDRKPCCTPESSQPKLSAERQSTGNFSPCTSLATTFREKMIQLPGGSFLMGTDSPEAWPDDGEGPVREVSLRPFLLAAHAVTNCEFQHFVESTGYRTDAEKYGWSYVFHSFVPKSIRKKTRFVQDLQWWYGVEGACWRKPEGPGSNLKRRADHPVVHVSWNDAVSFTHWAGARLPTEAEWEFAARGGLVQKIYPWGDELRPGGRHMCNIWQGTFPTEDTGEDGFRGTAPVTAFRPNGYGIYNMAGNVWEWCTDWYSTNWHLVESLRDPSGPPTGERKVMKGGSYLCHHSYCNRYRIAARSSNTLDTSTGNCGFRIAFDAPLSHQPTDGCPPA